MSLINGRKKGEDKMNALNYAEKYGIIDYQVKDNKMIYYANYPKYLDNPRYTMKVTVNLDTLEEERQRLKRWNPKGNSNLRK